MEWNGTQLTTGMGGSLVRASTPPRLLHDEKLLASSSSSWCTSIASHCHTVAIHPQSKAIPRISLPLCPKPVPQQKSSMFHPLPFSFFLSSSFRCCFSSSSSPPATSLMSSRLAPAYSSFCRLTQLDSRTHRGPKCRGNSIVKASVDIRSNSALRDCCWKDRRVAVADAWRTRRMDRELNAIVAAPKQVVGVTISPCLLLPSYRQCFRQSLKGKGRQ